VVFGKATGFADIDVSTMTGEDGFRIFGADEDDRAGWSISSAGDVNGDGFGDLIVGAPNANGIAGEAIVVFGKATGFADIDVSTMTEEDGFRIFGADLGDRAGHSVSSAGDINGDGFDDLIVGAPGGKGPTNANNGKGEAIVVFGKATGFADIDVSTMTGADGFRIFGADINDEAGYSVSSAGDINGDGFDDLMVGAWNSGGAASGYQFGEAIVVFGKATGFADLDVSAPDFVSSGAGFRIFGADEDDDAGWSVSSAGDINGDGFDDLIVGAREGEGPANDKPFAGEAIVIYGGNLTGSVVFAGTSGADTLTGTAAAETFVGGQGADTMIGGGGADSFRGGEGDDLVVLGGHLPRDLDGGSGSTPSVSTRCRRSICPASPAASSGTSRRSTSAEPAPTPSSSTSRPWSPWPAAMARPSPPTCSWSRAMPATA